MIAPALLRDRARRLRRDQTEAERQLWRHVRDRRLGGAKFRRQHDIGPFIVDFCCPERRLVIELDGGQHAERTAADQQRRAYLEAQGYQVLRFWNHEVVTNLEGVWERIEAALAEYSAPSS